MRIVQYHLRNITPFYFKDKPPTVLFFLYTHKSCSANIVTRHNSELWIISFTKSHNDLEMLDKLFDETCLLEDT